MKPRFVLLLGLTLLCASRSFASPALVITNLPAYGTTNNLSGLALNADPAMNAVVVFIYVPGYGWVSKPTCAQPLTTIRPDGSWTADITTGGTDELATRVAALLVGTNYSEPCVLGLANLPTNIYAQALAKTVVTRPQPSLRCLSFSGYDWWVKTSATPVGPGPNYFSDTTNNVWTDTNGWLHLRVTHRSNQWQCAEIVSARTFGYGSYRFELNSAVDFLDPNVVLGLFTWSDDPAFTYREIDVECSRWSNAADTNNAQFVVQPWDLPGHLARYRVPAAATNSTHLFTWQANQITHASQRGAYSPNPNPTNIIAMWSYALTVPQTGDENVRLNFWLNQGNPPANGQETEVVIKSFQFVPPGGPRPARLKDFGFTPPGQARFTLLGEADWRYRLQSSPNLTNWPDLATVLAATGSFVFADTNPIAADQQFYRAITLP